MIFKQKRLPQLRSNLFDVGAEGFESRRDKYFQYFVSTRTLVKQTNQRFVVLRSPVFRDFF
jgi:hypothetical protein